MCNDSSVFVWSICLPRILFLNRVQISPVEQTHIVKVMASVSSFPQSPVHFDSNYNNLQSAVERSEVCSETDWKLEKEALNVDRQQHSDPPFQGTTENTDKRTTDLSNRLKDRVTICEDAYNYLYDGVSTYISTAKVSQPQSVDQRSIISIFSALLLS